MKYEQSTYLSDGTMLSQSQSDEINRDGWIVVPDGRVLVKTKGRLCDYLYVGVPNIKVRHEVVQ